MRARRYSELLPEGYAEGYRLTLFHTQRHRQLQSPEGWHSLYLLDDEHARAKAAIHIHTVGDSAYSPLKAPLGSFIWAPEISEEEIFAFISYTVAWLAKQHVREVQLTQAPAGYPLPHQHLGETLALNVGFSVARAEVSALLPVQGSGFEHGLDAWEKRKLRQAREAGLQCTVWPVSRWQEVYTFIRECRSAKGYALSMAMPEVGALVDAFPDHVLLYAVLRDQRIMAASLALQVMPGVVYNFYSDHHPEADHLSPVVMLLAQMYADAASTGGQWIDLGTSMIHGQPNFPLLAFKKRLGAMLTPKLSLHKKL
jgi:hypothetical protein